MPVKTLKIINQIMAPALEERLESGDGAVPSGTV